VHGVEVEILSVNAEFAPFVTRAGQTGLFLDGTRDSDLFVDVDSSHLGVVNWIPDTIVSPGAFDAIVMCNYTLGPGAHLLSNGTSHVGHHVHPSASPSLTSFASYRVLELVTDTEDPERHSLSRHRMTRLLAPNTMENPIFFHAVNTSQYFEEQIDQMAEVGFEMLIYSFGSDFNMENASADYIASIKQQIDYAHSKGIEVGGYDLICLERGDGM
jgi:hypothetical protein